MENTEDIYTQSLPDHDNQLTLIANYFDVSSARSRKYLIVQSPTYRISRSCPNR